MEPEHQKAINDNLQILVEKTNFESLSKMLVVYGIITRETRRRINSENPSIGAKNRALYKHIQTIPSAFKKLIDSLLETNQNELAGLIGKIDVKCALDCAQKGSSDEDPLVIIVKKAEMHKGPSNSESYKMGSNPKGNALIINNIDFIPELHLLKRDGAEVDGNNMRSLLAGLGYRVQYHENCDQMAMRNQIVKFSEMEEHKDVDSAIIVIMSHGTKDVFYSTDSKEIREAWVLSQFNNVRCPALLGKPKIFFFQACRGDEEDLGHRYGSDGHSQEPKSNTQPEALDVTCSDMYVVRSTVSGYVSIRDHIRGSWFIEVLCVVFMEWACKKHLEALIRKAQQRIARMTDGVGRKQMLSGETVGMMYKVYFNPDSYDD